MLDQIASPAHQPKTAAGPVAHIIGAGLAGLSAAVRICQRGGRVAVYEAAGQAGGRCRSYYDAQFGQMLDNGNHLLLSGNKAALDFLSLIGTAQKVSGPSEAAFAFADLKSGERWTLKMTDGLIPWWLFDKSKRVPGTKPADYLAVAGLFLAGKDQTVADYIAPSSLLYKRLWEPVLVAALNTHLDEASAKLAGSIMRNTLAKGGGACRPLVAEGLSAALIDPAMTFIRDRGAAISLNARVKSITFDKNRGTELDLGSDRIMVSEGDQIVIAVPPWVAATLLPGLNAPTEHRSILNAHFNVAPPPHFPEILGVINGMVEWVFAFPNRLSITVSAADRVIDRGRDELAADIWREVSGLTGLPATLPPWQIVKEKRATFAATPEQDAKRPETRTQWRNVFIAGDWVQTGLPATIEGAIRSGEAAARFAMRGMKTNGTSAKEGRVLPSASL